MGTGIKQMYLDLNELLEDICQFLSGDKLENLSPKDQKLAESLINRSKIQLQEISKIQTYQNNEEYMVMDKKVIEKEDDKTRFSVDKDLTKKIEVTIMDKTIYPYTDLLAKEASREVKYGFIFMKRRFLLGFEKMKRVYGSIHNGWLLIYCTDRESKPISTFNLRNYEAKEIDEDKVDFQLINTVLGKKTYHFMALTRKDVKQWVTQINKCHDHTIMNAKTMDFERRSLGPENSFKYEDGMSDDETDSIYETLKTDVYETPPKCLKTTFAGKPELPGRAKSTIGKSSTPIKVSPPVVKSLPMHHSSSDEDLGSYHEISSLKKQSSGSLSNSTKSFENSFSDDEEDSIYEQFSTMQEKVSGLKNISAQSEKNEGSKQVNVVPIIPVKFVPGVKTSSSAAKPPPLPLPPPPLPPSEHNKKKQVNTKSTIDSEDSDDSTYDQFTTVQNKIVDLEASKTRKENKVSPSSPTKPKLRKKPAVSLKPTILRLSVKSRKQ